MHWRRLTSLHCAPATHAAAAAAAAAECRRPPLPLPSNDHQGLPGKKKLLTLRGGYHGDTFGAMAICDPANGMHAQLFEGALIEHFFAPTPAPDRSRSLKSWDGDGAGGGGGGAGGGDDCVAGARVLLEANGDQIAALIVEPLVQGAGGMRFYSPETLRALRALCDE